MLANFDIKCDIFNNMSHNYIVLYQLLTDAQFYHAKMRIINNVIRRRMYKSADRKSPGFGSPFLPLRQGEIL